MAASEPRSRNWMIAGKDKVSEESIGDLISTIVGESLLLIQNDTVSCALLIFLFFVDLSRRHGFLHPLVSLG